ncbi:hypothetical protein [Streptomyces sp. NPDC004528]|uniref:putative antirestriction adenine methyltransferase n=1 Tax=Streptomyces sp. NPDC004528 TaxID=3154550 RepID=UPI00339E720B
MGVAHVPRIDPGAPPVDHLREHAGTWPGEDIYVGSSGNLTIERVLHARFGSERRIQGNGIPAYSCALGWYLAGDPLGYSLHEGALWREEAR